jgi:hypothetical protein
MKCNQVVCCREKNILLQGEKTLKLKPYMSIAEDRATYSENTKDKYCNLGQNGRLDNYR